VAKRLEESARVIDAQWPPAAYLVASAHRIRGARWIPAGAATPLAVLGHVNAALELAEQIDRGECEPPKTLIVPLGTGGTAAGLALGLKLAGIATRLVAVRVVPRILGRMRRVLHLANGAAALIERVTGVGVPRVDRTDVRLEHAFYGGGYGRPLPAPTATEAALQSLGVTLDDTYCRKAFAAASAQTDHPTLFWLTFDGRLLLP
jgi:D-cysteine desulfhydrase